MPFIFINVFYDLIAILEVVHTPSQHFTPVF